jgi:hypothetical protein
MPHAKPFNPAPPLEDESAGARPPCRRARLAAGAAMCLLPLVLAAPAVYFRVRGALDTSAHGGVQSAPAQPPSRDPEAVVDYLTNLAHGPRRTGEHGRQLLEQVRSDPQAFAHAIGRRLVLLDEAPSICDKLKVDGARIGAALGLVPSLGSTHGGSLVREFFDSCQASIARIKAELAKERDAAATASLQSARRTLVGLRNGSLRIMSEFRDRHAVQSVLGCIEETAEGPVGDRASQSIMVDYVRAVAHGDEEVQRRIHAMVEDPKSPLHDDPVLRAMWRE